jgi:hypothetical protein
MIEPFIPAAEEIFRLRTTFECAYIKSKVSENMSPLASQSSNYFHKTILPTGDKEV